jgi:hypothetical protein
MCLLTWQPGGLESCSIGHRDDIEAGGFAFPSFLRIAFFLFWPTIANPGRRNQFGRPLRECRNDLQSGIDRRAGLIGRDIAKAMRTRDELVKRLLAESTKARSSVDPCQEI